MFKNLICETENGVGKLRINRPSEMNAINEETIEELSAALDTLNSDPAVRAVIVTGGEKVFVAGGDIGYMANAGEAEMAVFIAKCHGAVDKITSSPKPYIAAISGLALGGGCELAMACDIRLASESAVFGQPEINLGIIPGSGGTQRLSRLVGEGWAKYLIFTGKTIDAKKALEIGLIQQLTSNDDLMPQAEKLAAALAKKSVTAMSAAKECIGCAGAKELSAGLAFERTTWAALFATHDQKEGMKAFLEKRKPDFS